MDPNVWFIYQYMCSGRTVLNKQTGTLQNCVHMFLFSKELGFKGKLRSTEKWNIEGTAACGIETTAESD